jgi:hypothetical protein
MIQEERLKEKGASAHSVVSAQYGTYNSGFLPDEANGFSQVRSWDRSVNSLLLIVT